MAPGRARPLFDDLHSPQHPARPGAARPLPAGHEVDAGRRSAPLIGAPTGAGNRALARFLRPEPVGVPSDDASPRPASRLLLQRTFTVKDAQGTAFADFGDVLSETRMAFAEHLSAVEAADDMDFPGVWGNYLENKGVFDHYVKVFYDSGGNYGEFDLGKAGDVVRLYFLLKKWVMRDVAAKGSGPDEAPLHPDFTPGNILFASMDSGKVGSIYFTIGRLRLVHGSGPEVAITPGVERFTISDADYQKYWKKYGSRENIERFPSCKPAAVGSGEKLVEFWPGKRHPSRGAPMPFTYTLTQAQLNIIFRACLSHDNGVLKAAMARDQGLAQIPLASG